MPSKVYFLKGVEPENLLRAYAVYDSRLQGKIAIKLHSGEKGNQNFLRPEYVKALIDKVGGTVVECNTAYDGARNATDKHLRTLDEHGWTKYFDVDLMDAEGPDLVLPIPDGEIIHEDYVGKNLSNYDSLFVLSHFKGHPMGGYGGALKQLSIGVASSAGKAWIHSGGKTKDQNVLWDNIAPQLDFLKAMAEAASAVHRHFDGRTLYMNVMKNMSVDCDCCAVAEDPCLKDIGVLISLDPVAIDAASLSLVRSSDDPGKTHFLERVDSRQGAKIIEYAEALGFGTSTFELIEL